MQRRTRGAAALTGLALALAACGSDGGSGSSSEGGGGGGEGGEAFVLGTTESISSLDPAGSYDLGSWMIVYNVYENLLTIPPGGNTPEPELAECEFAEPTVYECVLREGAEFADGSPLTAEDVTFSFQRTVDIADENGPSTLLGSMESVEAVDETTVRFNLTAPDATWPFVLTTGAGAIVPQEVFPADELLPSDQVVGSGPYQLSELAEGQQALLEPNESYGGQKELANSGTIVRYFDEASALKLAVEQGDVDVAYRSLSPTDISDLEGRDGVQVVEGQGTEIRYVVFNTQLPPVQDLAVRQAVASVVDRQTIADDVYSGTVEPLYSMVPAGLEGHTEAFRERYGEGGDVEGARALLEGAGVTTPVPLTLWYTPTRYGPTTVDEYTELKRQLDGSGLFTVTLDSAEYQQYREAYPSDQYAAYQLGWFPDFPDADNYTAPFFVDGGFFNNHYSNPRVNELVQTERTTTDQEARVAAFEEIQSIVAEEVPTLPIWQGNQQAVVRDGITGVEETFDPSFIFRFWLVGSEG